MLTEPRAPDERTPPSNDDDETLVLAAMLVDPDAIAPLRAIVGADDFHFEHAQAIFALMLDLVDRGDSADIATVGAELRRRDLFEDFGGKPFLDQLADSYMTSAHAVSAARRIREMSLLRQGVKVAERLQREAYRQPENVPGLFADHGTEIAELAEAARRVRRPESEAIEAEVPRADPAIMLAALPETGFLRDYFDWARPCTDAPPHFHILAGLSCVAAALGNRCYLDTGAGIYPNLYGVMVAPSSRFRKSTVLGFARRLLHHLGPDAETEDPTETVVLPSDFSPEGFLDVLAERPTGILLWSELAATLAKFGRTYMAGIAEMLTDLYDCPPRLVRQLRSERIVVKDPCISLMAATTAEWLTEHLRETTAIAGFLPRFVFIGAEHEGALLARPPGLDHDREQQLAGRLNGIRQGYPEGERTPVSIDLIGDEYDLFARDLDARRKGRASEALHDAFTTRLGTTALKLALLFEAAENPGAREITPESWARAERMTHYLQSYVAVLLEEVTWTEWGAWRRKALQAIRDAGVEGIRRRALTRGVLQGLEKRRRDELLDALQEEGVVIERTGAGGQRGPAPSLFITAEHARGAR